MRTKVVPRSGLNRRRFLARGSAGVAGASVLPWIPSIVQAGEVCVDGRAERTPAQTAGPFHVPGAPDRDDFVVEGMEGDALTVQGLVLNTACQPIAGATLDVWQADPNGVYDTKSFDLRGMVHTDADGRFRFKTLKPGAYGRGFVRTPHIHVRIHAEGLQTLTTQVYFPEEEELNAQDALYRPDLLLSVSKNYAGLSGTYNFVLNPA